MIYQSRVEGQTRSEILLDLTGAGESRAAQLVLISGLWNDDIAPQIVRRTKARMFDDDLLRAIAAYSVGSLSTYGCNDLATVERLLRERFTGQAVAITIETIRKLAELIDAIDVQDALTFLANGSRVTV